MLRRLWCLAVLIAAMALSAGGCRSCESCHDYSGPVAGCQSGSCGYGRSGSASGGYAPVPGNVPVEGEVVYQ